MTRTLVTVILMMALIVLPPAQGQGLEIAGSAGVGPGIGGFITELHLSVMSNKFPKKWRHHRLSLLGYEGYDEDSRGRPAPGGGNDTSKQSYRYIVSVAYGKGIRVSTRWYLASLTGGPALIITPVSFGVHAHTSFLFMPLVFGVRAFRHSPSRDRRYQLGWMGLRRICQVLI